MAQNDRLCSATACTKKVWARGWCSTHYSRWRIHGDVNRVDSNAVHGMSRSGMSEYRAWESMRRRCNKPADKYYHRYGGRGIKLCERWNDFQSFYEDMGPRPSASHSIDRIDNNGDYEPGNCRWATPGEQAANRSTNHHVYLDGEWMIAAEAARRLGCSGGRVLARLNEHDVYVAPKGKSRKAARKIEDQSHAE